MEGWMMMMMMIKSVGWVVVIAIMGLCAQLYKKTVMVRRKLERQGIKGPPPSLLSGNVPEMHHYLDLLQYTTTLDDHSRIVAHDYTSSLFPYLYHWRQRYGRVYTYSTGLRQHVYVNQPELVRELNQAHTLGLGKVTYVTKRLRPILGRGVIASNGPLWAHQRRLIAPEFFMDKVKGMVGLMVESAMPMLKKWEERVGEGDIRVDEELRAVSADVIARACFGSSFSKGKDIFSKLRSLQKAITQHSILFTFHGFVEILLGVGGNKKSKNIEKLEKEVEDMIWEIVKRREKECVDKLKDKDLLQSILESAMSTDEEGDVGTNKNKVSYKCFVVDNCKSLYFAGHETTAVAASWCLMLLALNPQWQSRIREEVSRFCKNGLPDADSISHLKTVTMVIQETLRLYPPGAFVAREALEETRIGNIVIPKGVCIWTLIPTLHRDPEIWGHEANEFKPERFKDGVSKACKHPQAYIPFGLGTRLCLGKNFGMVELKVLISLIVSRFTFSLSSAYRHSPEFRLLVEPKHGVLLRLMARHELSCSHI